MRIVTELVTYIIDVDTAMDPVHIRHIKPILQKNPAHHVMVLVKWHVHVAMAEGIVHVTVAQGMDIGIAMSAKELVEYI